MAQSIALNKALTLKPYEMTRAWQQPPFRPYSHRHGKLWPVLCASASMIDINLNVAPMQNASFIAHTQGRSPCLNLELRMISKCESSPTHLSHIWQLQVHRRISLRACSDCVMS